MAQIQTLAYPMIDNLPALAITTAQLILILITFLYFRNKMGKNMRALNEQIRRDRKALESQKQHLSRNLLKINKSLNSLKESQHSILNRAPLATAISQAQLKPHLFAILSLPKCGGSTVAATLSHAFPDSLIRHWHIFSQKSMQRFADEAGKATNEKIKTAMLQHLGSAVKTRGIINQLGQKNITFLAGVREPISFALSLFFEQGLNYGRLQKNLTTSEVKDYIESSQEIRWFDLFQLDRWFDEDLHAASGHDIFAKTFPKDIGYTTFRGKKRRPLCLSYGKFRFYSRSSQRSY